VIRQRLRIARVVSADDLGVFWAAEPGGRVHQCCREDWAESARKYGVHAAPETPGEELSPAGREIVDALREFHASLKPETKTPRLS
jgi:hypothetical protein